MATTTVEERTVVRPNPTATGSNDRSTQAVVTKLKIRKRRRRTFLIVAAGIIVLLAVLGIVSSRKEKPITIQTEKVSRRDITEEVRATGKVQPQVAVNVSSEVPGEVVELPFKEGARVRKGDVIARIKPTTFQDQLDQADASLSSTKARELSSKAALINAKQELTRAKGLAAQNLLSESDLQAAQAKYDAAVATSQGAKFDVAAAQSSVHQFAEAVRKTTVFAPMDGVITSLITQLGEKVVGTSQFDGTKMMTISDLSWMNAEVDVDENDVVNIKLGDTAMVTIDAFPGRTFVGEVIEVANSATLKGNGTQDQSTDFKVKVKLSGFGESELKPGMSCTAKIRTQTKTNVMAIPINAVTRRDNAGTKVDSAKKASATSGTTTEETPVVVFVVGKDSRVKMVQVKTGISDNAYVEILSGLVGDEEIAKGNYTAVSKDLEDKSLVKVDNSATPATPKS